MKRPIVNIPPGERAADAGMTMLATRSMDHDQAPLGRVAHRWMMIGGGIPMLVIAVVLVATGAARAGYRVAAVACTPTMLRDRSGGPDQSR